MDLNSVIYDISGWFTGNDAGTCAMLDDIPVSYTHLTLPTIA